MIISFTMPSMLFIALPVSGVSRTTQFIVMTLPDVEITWLPEQESVSLFRVMGRPQELAS